MKTVLLLTILCVCAFKCSNASVAKPTCGGSTSSKDIQLLQPAYPPRECHYKINAYSSYVCQLRIDFDMILAQPTLPASDNNLAYTECVQDYFQVGDLKLCGTETSQHIYVPFNRTAGEKQVELHVILAARAGSTGLPTPSWNMRVTQLECPAGASVRELRTEPTARATIKDGFFVAPPGCLQYFPQEVGSVYSFNYNNGNGAYPGHLNYAICFRRDSQVTALEISPFDFNLGANDNNNFAIDDNCYSHSRSTAASDYLLVPQATILNSDTRATYFCGNSIQDATIRSTNPGPLLVIFNSDGVQKSTSSGFAFNYKVL